MSNGRYRAYPEYKFTGAEWLTSVPASWAMFEGKRIFESCREISHASDEQLAASQRFGVVPQSLMMELNDAKVMLALKGTSSFRHVEKNDYVISLRSFEGGIEYSAYTGCVSPAYTVLRPRRPIAPGFYKHLFKSRPYISALQATTDSLRDGKAISYEQFGTIPLMLPPLPEQTQIAAFLDHETAKIDRLIEKQEELIRLLKEKRQAVISHAVTKGLNPHAPLKDSGIEWLGQVPSHWVVLQFKFLIRSIDQGKSPECEGRLASPEEWGVLKSGCVNRGVFLQEEHKALPAKIAPTLAAEVKEGDLLMSRASGSTDLIGSVGLVGKVRSRLMMSDKIFRIHPESGVLPKFIWRMAASIPVRKQIELSINGAAGLANNLTKESIGRLWIARPPLAEQEAITDYLESRCARFDFLISNAEHQVTLLQERRTALISAAVTGKIDVRHWQPPAGSETGTPPDRGAFA